MRRKLDDEVILVLLNYSSHQHHCALEPALIGDNIMINNYASLQSDDSGYTLEPWQAVVIRIA